MERASGTLGAECDLASGNAEAQDTGFLYDTALMYAKGQGVPQDYAKAALWFRMAAEKGDVDAQVLLGTMYTEGSGVPQDDTQAAFWVRKAAEQGYTLAQGFLGHLYDKGLGVPQDYAQAALWFRKAAEQGDAKAQYALGYMYFDGEGVPQDYAEAYFWLGLAVASGQTLSKPEHVATSRDKAASHLTPAELSHAQERARKWFEAHQAKPQ
jgi:TPR repeat protein